MKPPDADDVRRMARLARVRVGDDEVARLTTDVARVLEHVETLFAVDVEGVEPLRQPGPPAPRLRPDVPEPALGRAAVAGSAGHTDGLVRVPRVLGAR